MILKVLKVNNSVPYDLLWKFHLNNTSRFELIIFDEYLNWILTYLILTFPTLSEEMSNSSLGLKTGNANLEMCVAAKEKALKDAQAKLRECQCDLDQLQQETMRKDKELHKVQEEMRKMKQTVHDAEQKVIFQIFEIDLHLKSYDLEFKFFEE